MTDGTSRYKYGDPPSPFLNKAYQFLTGKVDHSILSTVSANLMLEVMKRPATLDPEHVNLEQGQTNMPERCSIAVAVISTIPYSREGNVCSKYVLVVCFNHSGEAQWVKDHNTTTFVKVPEPPPPMLRGESPASKIRGETAHQIYFDEATSEPPQTIGYLGDQEDKHMIAKNPELEDEGDKKKRLADRAKRAGLPAPEGDDTSTLAEVRDDDDAEDTLSDERRTPGIMDPDDPDLDDPSE